MAHPSTESPLLQTPSPTLTYGSDALAHLLSQLPIPYLALVPGSSFRGLHDSLVNYQGNHSPSLIVCLHEEHAIAIAHGYAKATPSSSSSGGRQIMAAAVHANVGLLHASMAVYDAWCDRAPVLVLGATGPTDAGARRPWIDWIHTAQDQGALVRPFVKYDDQPAGVDAAVESVLRAYCAATTGPHGPTYVCLDVRLQEGRIGTGGEGEGGAKVRFPDVARYLDATSPRGPSGGDVRKVVEALGAAKRPVFLFGRVSRERKGWEDRIALAEKFDARVLTDLKQAAAFPTAHPLHASAPGVFISEQTAEVIRSADLIVSFDWVDLGGTMKAAVGNQAEPNAKVIHISMDSVLHTGWSKDHFALPPADIAVFADPDQTVAAILAVVAGRDSSRSTWETSTRKGKTENNSRIDGDIFMSDLATALYTVYHADEMCLVRLPLGWIGGDLQATHPLAFLGMDGGAGVGSGPGMVVGAAIALRDAMPHVVPVGVLGDGDFLMGNSAIWTAAKYRVPMLIIVANNASYFNDEAHQERVAKHRGRLVENKWIGVRLDNPSPDLHQIAEGFGCTVVRKEQVRDRSDLVPAISDAAKAVKAGKSVVLDVRVLPEGYSSAMSDKAKTTSS